MFCVIYNLLPSTNNFITVMGIQFYYLFVINVCNIYLQSKFILFSKYTHQGHDRVFTVIPCKREHSKYSVCH